MSKRKERLARMIGQIDDLIAQAEAMEQRYAAELALVHPHFERSACNLLHYRALRNNDLRDLQKMLGNMGLSRLAKAQSHVLASLWTIRAILQAMHDKKAIRRRRGFLTIKKANRFSKRNAKAILGYRSKGRRTRIMVTLPSKAAQDYQFVYDLVAQGMNCARINCAHDGPEQWAQMIAHVRKASGKLKNRVVVTMDLGGPKIRTGGMAPGPAVLKFTPRRDPHGRLIEPVRLWLGPRSHSTENGLHLPLQLEGMHGLQPEDKIYFRDTRGKVRELLVTDVEADGCWAFCFDSAFLQTGARLYRDPNLQGQAMSVGALPAKEQFILLNAGDRLRIRRDPAPGEPARQDERGGLLAPAHISCTAPEVFDMVRPGEPILFDDGKIEGKIREVDPQGIEVEIIRTKQGGGKLKADKGINLPESRLTIRGLTDKDRQDLTFVVENADVVNMSFVNSAEDVRDLIAEIDRLGGRDRLGVILKIETQSAFNNLTEILLAAMQMYPVGVMIARGDLAIETGWNNIGRVQEEILSICQAAHVPDIWATQVLENLAKKGIPSRAEITDAAMAQRAEGVMLNKGPYILEAIELLDMILKDLEPYWEKSAPMTPKLSTFTD